VLAKPVACRWRRYLRLSLRGLIVLVLLIGVALGWLVRSAHIQRDAVAAIENARGIASYDWQRKGQTYSPGAMPDAPRWLVDLIGVDYFGHVTHVAICYPSNTTEVPMAQIEHLTRLKSLCLSGSTISDEGLAHVTGLTNLSILELTGTRITDAGLAHLKGLANLAELHLDSTQTTAAGLKNLKALTKLTHVVLDGEQINDTGVKELRQALPSLNIFFWPPLRLIQIIDRGAAAHANALDAAEVEGPQDDARLREP
jgi:internalin A